METGVLKSFAGEARRQLLSEVRARLDLVLAEGSTQRREFAEIVRKLESAVDEAGGSDAGRGAVVDRVAYTWFNRIVALRFMDANGFTDGGVVSPAVDRPDGQPEVLVEAKRGVIDTDVVAPADTQRIAGLLNGSVTSSDPESEAFGLLLAAYCRFWNRSMPFMFEHSADYTEMLMPADLLSDESVIARAASVLTPDVCVDVEAIGWLYQFYIAERKDEVFAGFKKGKKAGAAEIPAATQLFTPDWIVRYLVENSLGRLWMLTHPDSSLLDRMDYYIAPLDEVADFQKIDGPEEIKVMDPACGSGHMLTYAFDLLFAMYEEDGYNPADIPGLILSKNLHGTEIDPRAGALAAFALTMKARARQRTFFTKSVTPNICVLEPVTFTPDELNQLVSPDGDRDAEEAFFTMFTDANTLGALIRPDEALLPTVKARLELIDDGGNLFSQDLVQRARQVVIQAEYLASGYQIVVANPPYMGARNMDALLGDFAAGEFPLSKADLFAMFIERNRLLVQQRGYVAMITMQSWMFLSSFEDLRRKLVMDSAVRVVAHLGTGAFESIAGAVVTTCAFVIEAEPDRTTPGTFIKLDDLPDGSSKNARLLEACGKADSPARFSLAGEQISQIPGATLSYWMGADLLAAFSGGRRLADVADPRQGMATADNARFLRLWTEVSRTRLGLEIPSRLEAQRSGRKWFPYNKGGSFRRWYGNQEYVVNWEDDGRELMAERPKSVIRSPQYYFCESASWSKVGTAEPAFRYFPPGFLFDVAGTSIFASDHDTLVSVLAFGNSVVAREMLRASASSMNLEVGTISELPIRITASAEIEALVDHLIRIYRVDWDKDERSWNFGGISIIDDSEASLRSAIDNAIDEGEKLTAVARDLEEAVNRRFIGAYGLDDLLAPEVRSENIALGSNYLSRFGSGDPTSARQAAVATSVLDLVSYAVGCMFGRYSLDEPGLILANQGDTLREYLARVPQPSFVPDDDNVIPVLADDWFDDDIVERFRLFLRVAFGEEHFEENLRFVEESLGKDIRRYFLTDFYKDHVQRYKKRPIYWMFSSAKSTFNALIYMHRYNQSTVSTVLNEYLREFQAKLEAELGNQARIAADPSASTRDKARAEKESDKIRKMLAELKDYEHDVLYPLASHQISIDLDDGVKANYPKFGTALKKIPGLEATND